MTIPDIYIEELARAWASIDGKVKGFDRCKMNAEEDLIDGFYSGYIAEAHELLRLSPAVSAVLSEQERPEGEWHRVDRSAGSVLLYTLREEGWRRGEPVMVNDVMINIDRGSGSSTDIEPIVQRIRSALADVPVEPVAAWLIEDGTDHVWFTVIQSKAQEAEGKGCEVTPLYTRPPHREGEDSAEVERLTRPIVGIEHRTAQEVFDIMADRIRLAATRSGSATTSNGGDHG